MAVIGAAFTSSLLGTLLFGAVLSAEPSRIRYANDRIAEVFAFATERSATFRGLVSTLQASNTIVYIDEGRCGGIMRACLQVLPFAAERRVSIRIDPRQPLVAVVRQLAHELQHASEVAVAADVVDQPSLRRLYERIGFALDGSESPIWETWRAQEVEAIVSREVTSSSAAVAPEFFGVWSLDVEASTFDNVTPPSSGLRWHRDRGHGLVSVVTETVDRRDLRIRVAFLYRPDGRDYQVAAAGEDRPLTIAETPVDRFTAEFVLKRGGTMAAFGRRVLDPTGRTLTIETRGFDDSGVAWHSVERWEKQDPAAGQ